MSHEDGDALLGSELQLGARGEPLLGRGRTEPFEVDAVRDDLDPRPDRAVGGSQVCGLRLGEAHHRTVRAPAIPDAVAEVDEDVERVAVDAPERPAPGPHGCEQEPVVDVDVADQHVVVRDGDRVGAVGEELAGAHRADGAEPHHAPAAADAARGSCSSASASGGRRWASWNVNRSTVAPSDRSSRSRFVCDAGHAGARADERHDLHDAGHAGASSRRNLASTRAGPSRYSAARRRAARPRSPGSRMARAVAPTTARAAPTASRARRSACAGTAPATRGSAPRGAAGRRPCPRRRAPRAPRARPRGASRAGARGTPSRPPRRRGRSARRTRRPASSASARSSSTEPITNVGSRRSRARPSASSQVPLGDGQPPLDARRRAVLVDLRRADAREIAARAQRALQHGDVVGRDRRVGVQQQHVGAGHEPVARAPTLTPAAKPPLRPGSR